MITIRTIRKNDFLVPWSGDPQLHEEVEWFAADGDRVLGVIVRDRVDDDYGFVVLSNADGGPFPCWALDSPRSAPCGHPNTRRAGRPPVADAGQRRDALISAAGGCSED
jgi:hypothetical protein